jgi:2-C-methyl-D-erythritol 2,4-cyclodiphosphate synthase
MGTRFDAGARRSILAAAIEAEKHGRSRPVPTDLLVGLLSLPESPVPATIEGLGADARALIAAATAAGTEGGERYRQQSPEDAERILQRAADLASARGGAEVGILDILQAALHGTSGAAADVLAAAGITAHSLPSARLPASSRAVTAPDAPSAPRQGRGYPRTGIGYDSHRFGDSGPLILGGIRIAESPRLVGHSDGDAIAHAITDAVLGASGSGDIGEMFADTDPANRGRDSLEMLRAAVMRVRARGLVVHQVDVTVVAERPKIAPHRDAMRAALAGSLGVSVDSVSVKGKTNEGMGWIGRGEGIACIAVATLIDAPAT